MKRRIRAIGFAAALLLIPAWGFGTGKPTEDGLGCGHAAKLTGLPLLLSAAGYPVVDDDAVRENNTARLADSALAGAPARPLLVAALQTLGDTAARLRIEHQIAPTWVIAVWFREGHLYPAAHGLLVLEILEEVCADAEARKFITGQLFQLTNAAWVDADVANGFSKMAGGYDQAMTNRMTMDNACTGTIGPWEIAKAN